MSTSPEPTDAKETGRIEAFSDGIFAIALTLLVLNIQVPRNLLPGTHLIDALLAQWPAYVAYIASFATIGIMWINHHYLFNLIRRVDHWLLVFNTLLLFGITSLPFPTALVAEYAGHTDEITAAAVYSGTWVVIALFWNLVWRYAAHHRSLLNTTVTPDTIRTVNRAYIVSPILYFVAFLFAFVNVAVMLAIIIGLAIFYALPSRVFRS